MPGYPAFDGFDDYEPQTIIIVYKDEMLLNQVKKLIEGKTIGDSGSHIKIVSWTEKVWLVQKKDGTIANKVLFLGDIKGTSALIPVVDTKFNKHGVRYGWAGKQAVLYAEPKEIKRFEDYESFWLEINGMPIPEIVKSGNKPKNPDADVAQKDTPDEEKETAPADSKKKNVFLKAKDFAVRKADALGKNVQKVATAASKASQDVFRNKSLVKRQMLFYGAVKLCESDLDDFMLS